jgi:hypothetical protein
MTQLGYPDFLLRGPTDGRVCGFHQGKPHKFDFHPYLYRKSGVRQGIDLDVVLPSLLLDKETNLFQNLFAHLDVAELRSMSKPELFPKPVQDGGIEIGALVQQMEQFRGGGRVLIIGLDAARILYGDGQGKSAKVAALLVG